jgi:hypothetical protein
MFKEWRGKRRSSSCYNVSTKKIRTPNNAKKLFLEGS